jgi:hypothetical protein
MSSTRVSPVPELAVLDDDVDAELSAPAVLDEELLLAAVLPALSDAAGTVMAAVPVIAGKLVAPLPPSPQAISPATARAKLARKRRISVRVAETRAGVTRLRGRASTGNKVWGVVKK